MRQCRSFIVCVVLCTISVVLVTPTVFTTAAQWPQRQIPEPDPPAVYRAPVATTTVRSLIQQSSPDTVWTFHKTADDQHPNGIEQQMIWLMNRARTDPTQEGLWLANLADSDVAGARSFFNVDLDILQAEFSAIQAKPPAAFDVRLYLAAMAHSNELIANDSQNHTGQLDRVVDAGFAFGAWRGNVFSYTRSGIHGHAGFNIDWGGNDGTGMQTGRGHRQAIMSIDGDYTNVGLAVIAESDSSTTVGPLVTTGNYCSAQTAEANHFNRFLVGTVWRDLNLNDQYDPVEGMGGITVRPDRGTYFAITADSGGYAIPILDAGTYTVVFSGSGLVGEKTRTVNMDSQSFLLDLVHSDGDPGTPEAITGSAAIISPDTVQLSGIVNANGHDVDYYFEYGPTTRYGNISDIYSTTANARITIVVSDLFNAGLYHFRLVVIAESDTVYGSDRSFATAPAEETESQIPVSNGGGGGGCFIQNLW